MEDDNVSASASAMSQKTVRRFVSRVLAATMAIVLVGQSWAADQVWLDANPDNTWSTSVTNWDAGVVWVNGNSAIFGGAGEAVDISGTVDVSNITFNVSGYTIGDADNDGTLTLIGAPGVISVVNAGHTNTISENIAGANGFIKMGAGTLQLTGNGNTLAGQLVISNGTVRLSPDNPTALGAAGTGNETIVTDGATLDLNGAYTISNADEDLIVSGSGVDGYGALINSGSGHVNKGFRHLTLMGDTWIGGTGRLDLRGGGTFTGNGYTLYKIGPNLMAVTRAVNGSPIVISNGSYTVQHDDALGGATAGDTTLAGGYLSNWGDRSIAETLHVYTGGYWEGRPGGKSTLSGNITIYGTMTFNSQASRTAAVSGVISGPGAVTNMNGGVLLLTTEDAGYQGETVNVGSSVLRIGETGGATGRLGLGDIVNEATIFFDRAADLAISNNMRGSGTTHIRYGAELTMFGSQATQSSFRVAHGGLTLTNGATLFTSGNFILASRMDSSYPVDPVQVTGVVNIVDGASLTAQAIIVGNGITTNGGSMIGVINQYGGTVRTTGTTAENNGIRLGHYPQGFGTYRMMGGTLIVDNGYDLGIATDGTGWVHQTGGDIFATTVMLNERFSMQGFGRLTLEGGTLHVGSGGITRDDPGPYLVEYGGSGGVVRATASFESPLDAALSGVGADAITFDTAGNTITLSGVLSGTGGLNARGGGTLKLQGNNSYSGATSVTNGTLEVNGVYSGGGLITVYNDGILSGTGTVGAVSVGLGGTLAPGTSPGVLTAGGAVSFSAASTFAVELNGTLPGTDHDQLDMSGNSLDLLNNPDLAVTLGYTPGLGDTFVIVTGLSGFDPDVHGIFNGKPDNSVFSVGSTQLKIDYGLSTITLTVVPEPAAIGMIGIGMLLYALRRRIS